MPKLVTHPTEDANAESSTENMDIESSREVRTTPSLRENKIIFKKDWLDDRLDFDLMWCMASNHGNDDEIKIPPSGSWAVFNSVVTDKRTNNQISITSQ